MATLARRLVIAMHWSLLLGFASPAQAEGEDEQPLDLILKTGALAGVLGSDEANDGKRNTLGGLVVAGMFLWDHNRWITNYIEPQIVIDLSGLSVLRKGGGAGLLWHWLGGPRNITRKTAIGAMTSKTMYNVSFNLRAGYYAYTARDIEGRSEPVEGSTAEVMIGLNAGFNTTDYTSIGVEMGASLLTIATSIERVYAKSGETNIYVRLTL